MSEENLPLPPDDDYYQFKIPFDSKVVNIPGIPTLIAFRPNLQEDLWIVQSVLVAQEYFLPIENFQPKLILDCGANIGTSAVYFANKYPTAQIYSIEPEENNFKLLQFNTIFYNNVHPIKSALWDKETFIRVEDKGFGNLGWMTFETTADDSEAFKTTTVLKLLNDSCFEFIDLLKIDIEGSEKEVFSAENVHEWLSRVNVLVIELHDRMKRGCSSAFFNAMSKYDWFFAFRGENLIFIREDRITEKIII